MKVEIIVEQFDNGISLKWSDGSLTKAYVAMEHHKNTTIGDVLWEDIKNLMDCTPTNKVKMCIEYEEAKEIVLPMPKIEGDYPGPR